MLMNLINDMMDLAKTENMKFELNNEYFDLTKTIERALDNMSYMAISKNIQSSIKYCQKLVPFLKKLNADEARYTQILLNFISNSLKFTPSEGSLSIEVKPNSD
jgi:signal transduction histidine kinase